MWLQRRAYSPEAFIGLFVVVNALLFQAPLLRFLFANVDLGSVFGWRSLIALMLAMAMVLAIVLLGIALVSLRALKLVTLVFLLGNAIALYFINTYQVLITKAMMGNVFNTDMAEATAYFNWRLLLWFVLLGVLPGIWISRLKWSNNRRGRRAGALLALLACLSATVYLNAPIWLWVDKHAKPIGALALPWSYLVNGVRYWQQQQQQNQAQLELPALFAPPPIAEGSKQVVVLVIGESARAANFSLYGYARNTNPKLLDTEVQAFRAQSCATYTTAALRCMLSARGQQVEDYPPEEPLTSYLYRQGVDVVWRSNNFGEPKMKLRQRWSAGQLLQRCADTSLSAQDQQICAEFDSKALDGVLLLGLTEEISASPSARVLVVLHQSGSHGPSYSKKYPLAEAHFAPVCESTDLSQCTAQSLLNAYDNTIVYADRILFDLIQRLKAHTNWQSTVLYVSDHGESLGEGGLYLHGAPNALAPAVQREIPFLVWRSQKATKAVQNTPPNMSPNTSLATTNLTINQDYVFHSVLGALGLESSVYAPSKDVFSQSFQPVASP